MGRATLKLTGGTVTRPILKQYSLMARQHTTPPSSLGARERRAETFASASLLGDEVPDARSGVSVPEGGAEMLGMTILAVSAGADATMSFAFSTALPEEVEGLERLG